MNRSTRNFSFGLLFALLGVVGACAPKNASPPLIPDAGASSVQDAGSHASDAASIPPLPDAALDASIEPDASTETSADVSVAPDVSQETGSEDAGLHVDAAWTEDEADGGDGNVVNRRDECSSDADCAGGRCLSLPESENATRYCVVEPQIPQISCDAVTELDSMNECCSDGDCSANLSGGVCASFSYGYCGGPPPPEANTCRYHGCSADVDCGPGHECMPAGVFGEVIRTCTRVDCRADVDCTARSGGECRPMTVGPCATLAGFFCTYSDDPCREDADCRSTFGRGDCVPTDEGTRCEESLPPP